MRPCLFQTKLITIPGVPAIEFLFLFGTGDEGHIITAEVNVFAGRIRRIV